MAMLEIQRKTLNEFGNSQPAFKPFGQLTGKVSDDIKLGNFIAGDGLVDAVKNTYFSHSFKLPAPAASLYYQHMPVFKVPCDGFLTKADLYCYDSITIGGSFTAGTAANQNYHVNILKYFTNFSTFTNSGIDLLTGMSNNTCVQIPVSEDVALMSTGCEYTLAATGQDIVFTATTVFANIPSVGDYLNISTAATTFGGTNLVNVGVYKVTEVSSTVVKATKTNRTAPMSIAASTVTIAGDVGSIRVYSASTGYPVYKGDQIGFWISVPAVGATPVDISMVSFCANFTYQPVLTFA